MDVAEVVDADARVEIKEVLGDNSRSVRLIRNRH